jgi:hypothetical protein
MNPQIVSHSQAWIAFTYAAFLAAVAMVGLGIFFAPVDLALKGYLAMGTVMLVQSCVTITKTMRDVQEANKLVNKIEDAKTERLLMGIERGKE